jgi:hypothetical protein
MSKVNFNPPFTGLSGPLKITDKSRGLDPAAAAAARKATYHWQVYVKKARVKKRSPAQIARAARYCYCDQAWTAISSQKMLHIKKWWLWARDLAAWQLPAYQTWMHGCLKNLPEMDLFYVFCWSGRYKYSNITDDIIPSQAIRLLDVPYLDSSGTDNEVWTLLPNTSLGENVSRVVVTPGTLEIIMPDVPPGGVLRWDVYSYPEM